jgi:citronellol/citronellal dehydrogenase
MLVAGIGCPSGEATARAFRELGGEALESPGGDAAAAQTQVDAAWAAQGRLDSLVTLAGAVPEDPAVFDPVAWRDGVERALSGSWFLMQAAARQWRDRGEPGCIVALLPPYRDTRPHNDLRRAVGASIVHLAKTVAVEWAAHRVRVNCIAAHSDDPRAVADAVVWLCAPSGKFVTGEVMNLGATR